jgi:hypothetical protein
VSKSSGLDQAAGRIWRSNISGIQELKMKLSFGAVLCAAVVAIVAFSVPANAKTAKECAKEWQADKKANQAKGITEKAFVAKCKEAGSAADKPKEKEKAAKAKAPKETAAEKKAAAGGDKKTVSACEKEWQADKKANQAKGITEKAYVEKCRGSTAAAEPKAAPAAPKETAKPTAPAAPAKTTAAPGPGKPQGANQYTSALLAKARCPTDTVVWSNLDSKIYHFAGHDDYGHTKEGAYMCEKDAVAQGIRAAKNEKHP